MCRVKKWVTYFPLRQESMHDFARFVLKQMDVDLINVKT